MNCLINGGAYDILLFPYAGAYGWHFTRHDYLSNPHPQRYYLSQEVAAGAWGKGFDAGDMNIQKRA
jgi:hypothetical protein